MAAGEQYISVCAAADGLWYQLLRPGSEWLQYLQLLTEIVRSKQ